MKKRAVRRHHRARVARNRRKLMLAKGNEHDAAKPDGRLAERHPYDCGRRCLMCHGDKFFDKTRRRRQQNFIPTD